MALLCCNYTYNIGDGGFDWPTVISSFGAVAVGVIALIVSYFQYVGSLNAKKEEERRKEIHNKLNEFYGPFIQLRKKSNLLYQKFSEDYRKKDSTFSTLIYLLDGEKFPDNDSALLKEIISIGEKCENLIHDKAGFIDDANLRIEIIPRATSHFLVLRLAYSGLLKGDIDKFRNLTFPKELDDLLEKRRTELVAELNKLNQNT